MKQEALQSDKCCTAKNYYLPQYVCLVLQNKYLNILKIKLHLLEKLDENIDKQQHLTKYFAKKTKKPMQGR